MFYMHSGKNTVLSLFIVVLIGMAVTLWLFRDDSTTLGHDENVEKHPAKPSPSQDLLFGDTETAHEVEMVSSEAPFPNCDLQNPGVFAAYQQWMISVGDRHQGADRSYYQYSVEVLRQQSSMADSRATHVLGLHYRMQAFTKEDRWPVDDRFIDPTIRRSHFGWLDQVKLDLSRDYLFQAAAQGAFVAILDLAWSYVDEASYLQSQGAAGDAIAHATYQAKLYGELAEEVVDLWGREAFWQSKTPEGYEDRLKKDLENLQLKFKNERLKYGSNDLPFKATRYLPGCVAE